MYYKRNSMLSYSGESLVDICISCEPLQKFYENHSWRCPWVPPGVNWDATEGQRWMLCVSSTPLLHSSSCWALVRQWPILALAPWASVERVVPSKVSHPGMQSHAVSDQYWAPTLNLAQHKRAFPASKILAKQMVFSFGLYVDFPFLFPGILNSTKRLCLKN